MNVCVCLGGCVQHYELARVRDSKLSKEDEFVGLLALPPGLVRVQGLRIKGVVRVRGSFLFCKRERPLRICIWRGYRV
jgi:hypothetical protein